MRDLVIPGLLASAVSLVASPALAQGANDQVEQYNFRVGAGRLSEVVGEIASQARASITLDKSSDSDTRINGITGTYTLREALDRALEGSPYGIEDGPNNTFRIVRVGQDTDIVVSARRRDFARTSSSLVTRTDTPLRQTPGTVDSVTEEVLRSQNAIAVNEALRNIPGVIFNTSNARVEAVIGQDTNGGITYLNGLQTAGIASNPPITDIAAIEVLKGPAAILSGASLSGGALPGGMINFVPKRADGRSGADVTIGFGTGNEILGSVDVGGAISRDDGIFWRVAALAQYADRSPAGGNRPTQKVINPMLGYRGDGIRIDASFQYYKQRNPAPLYASLEADGRIIDYGKTRISADSGTEVESRRGSYNLEIDLVKSPGFSLTLRSRGLYQYVERASQYQVPNGLDNVGGQTFLLNYSESARTKQLSEYVDLYAKFSTGPLDHQMILAGDLMHATTYRNQFNGFGFSNATTPLPLAAVNWAPSLLSRTRQYGIVLQDQINWGRFHALLGLRQSYYRNKSYRYTNGQYVQTTTGNPPRLLVADVSKFLFNGGLVYDVSKAVSVYFAYSNTFSPYDSSVVNVSGENLPPTTRRQFEIGAKAGLFDDKLTLNLSAFQYQTDNFAINVAGTSYYESLGGVKGKGVEIAASGSITPTLKVLGGYTYSTSVSTTNPGTPIVARPQHVANLWAIQTFKLGGKQSLDVGFGGNYNSGYYAYDYANSITSLVWKYVDYPLLSVNGSLTYTIGQFSVNAVVNNIFDRRNFQPTSSIAGIPVEAGRSFRINFRARI